jgi:hypothetical protein
MSVGFVSAGITANASGIKEVGFFFQPISFNPLLSVWFHFLFVRWKKNN